MINGVIFDCFGVLYGSGLKGLLALTPSEHLRDMQDLSRACDYGYITTEQYYGQAAEFLGRSPDEVRSLLTQSRIRNDPLVRYVHELKGRVKLGFLSNIGSGTMDQIFDPDERRQLFDAELLSFEIHLAKPDPAIFRLMAERLGLPAGECVMVDDLSDNCEGAEIAGMYSIMHIDNDSTRKRLSTLIGK